MNEIPGWSVIAAIALVVAFLSWIIIRGERP